MQFGRLFLAGDAAHIVPATGAKGLNLAVADVRRLSEGLTVLRERRHRPARRLLRRLPAARLARAALLVVDDVDAPPFGADPYQHRLQISELRYVTSSTAAATTLAENYVGIERI